jgi:predicted phosphodiesterase
LNAEDRLASVHIVTEAARKWDKPVILAGDINAVPDSPVLDAFRENWRMLSNPRHLTFRSDNPTRKIDYILGFTDTGFTYSVWQTRVLDEPVASDHLPIFADIRLRTEKENIFRTPVYLQNPSTDGMTVMWLTNVPALSWVEFGTDTLNMQIAKTWVEGIAMAGNTVNRIRLSGLQPGTRYYYRVHSREITLYEAYRKEFGKTASTEIRSFTTFDDYQTDFTAVIFNDLHDIFPLFDRLNEQVKDIPFDIAFFNGDIISDVQTKDAAVRTISHFTRGIGGDSIPSVFVRGNHEARGAFSPFLWDLLGKVGTNSSYGAFSIGDTRFVVLDVGEDKPDDFWVYFGMNDFTQFRRDQATFLKEETISDEFLSANRRILIHHIPLYDLRERRADHYQQVLAYVRELWGETLAAAPFDVVLNGHTHRFTHYPVGKAGNNFPVVIGGGSNERTATVKILQKRGEEMTLRVLNVEGETLLYLNL